MVHTFAHVASSFGNLHTTPLADSFCHYFVRFVLLARGASSSAKLDSLEIISGAPFHIIGLTKIPKIKFLPLDRIYLSIRIMTVSCSFFDLLSRFNTQFSALLAECSINTK